MSRHRIALISDVHGNEVALRAVFCDIGQNGVDRIACLGDVAALGPRPRETLSLLREKVDVFVLGNHDENLFRQPSEKLHPAVLAAEEHCRGELGAEELEFIRGFVGCARVPVPGAGGLLLFHGSPDSNTRNVLSDTPEDELDVLLEGDADVMAGGHTHLQMLRRHRGRWLLNPGSVGLPFERFVEGRPPKVLPHAEYAVVEWRNGGASVSLHHVELDRRALLDAARAWDCEFAAYLAEQYAAP
jgi:predicted phosphodiesterase